MHACAGPAGLGCATLGFHDVAPHPVCVAETELDAGQCIVQCSSCSLHVQFVDDAVRVCVCQSLPIVVIVIVSFVLPARLCKPLLDFLVNG